MELMESIKDLVKNLPKYVIIISVLILGLSLCWQISPRTAMVVTVPTLAPEQGEEIATAIAALPTSPPLDQIQPHAGTQFRQKLSEGQYIVVLGELCSGDGWCEPMWMVAGIILCAMLAGLFDWFSDMTGDGCLAVVFKLAAYAMAILVLLLILIVGIMWLL